MGMTCVFCKTEIPKERVGRNHPHPRYCSRKCIKTAFYIRNNPKILSKYTNPIKWIKTEIGRGRKWEEFVSNLLGGTIQPFGHPFDIEWKGLRIDVKSASLYKRKRKRGKEVNSTNQAGWFRFDRGELVKDVDYFFCIGIIEGIPSKMYFIPGKDFGKRGITISPIKSKYDKFIYRSV